jgi:CotH kinase protein/Secretion system C-terminal sorting domain
MKQVRFIRVLLTLLLGFVCIQTGLSQSFTSSNLPVIVINTNGAGIPDEPKITADMGIIDNGAGVRNNLTDPFNNYSGKIGIEVRGSSSQSFPKKQYGIELRDALGNGINASLLGMPAEEDWILFAPYNDKALMRDVLAYKLARDMGRYAPRTRFCEMVLNGQYMGVFVLMEKIKRDDSRVNVAKLNPTEITGDDLTGGYIIKIDKETGSGNGGWSSSFAPPDRSGSQQIYFQYDYPSATEIVTEQRNYIRQYVNSFETVLNGSTFNDPVNGYSKYMDVDSFIDFFIMNEVSKNVDGYRLSTYLHKKKDSDGGKLSMGPVWDFNLSFGNADYCTKGNPQGWVTSYNNICPQDYWLIPFWWNRLYSDGAYRNRLAARWNELRSNQLNTDKILTYIDSVTSVLNAESQQRNFQRWPVLGQYVWPNYYVGPTFESEVNWLKGWVVTRLDWLDANMPKLITGIEFNTSDFSIEMFPNPFRGEVQINYTMQTPGTISVEIFDLLGRSVKTIKESRGQLGTHQTNVQVQNLPPGNYYYKATTGNGRSITGKMIKCE